MKRPQPVSAWLATARSAAGLTQTQLAAEMTAAGLTHSRIQQPRIAEWEAGAVRPSAPIERWLRARFRR